MASTSISTSESIAQKVWRPGLIHSAERHWIAQDLMGTDEESAIQIQDEPSRQRGDTVQVRFSPTEEHAGFGEDDDIEGNEAKLNFDFDELKIGFWAHAFSQRNQMSQQRVNIDLKKAAMQKLPVLWQRRMERSILNQLGGAQWVTTAAGLTALQALDSEYSNLTHKDNNLAGMNSCARVDASHTRYAKGSANAAAVAADTTAVMSLSLIDDLVLRAESRSYLTYPIPPTSSGYWYLIVHSDAARQLRNGTSAGDWQDLQRALLEGGFDYKRNPIYRNHLGLYGNVIVVKSDYVPRAADADDTPLDNTRANIFIGAKAGICAYGQGYTDGQHLDWVEQVRNYKVWGVSADSVYGVKRLEFSPDLTATSTNETYGCMIGVTYAPT